MNNSSILRSILIFLVAVGFSLWMGMNVATNQTETVIYIASAGLLLTCALLGQRIWLMLIFMCALEAPVIRGITTTQLGHFLFIIFAILLFLMRKLKWQFRVGELEVWGFLIILCIVQSYIRNPAGLNIFGSSLVGGRPYFVLALAIASGLLLSSLRINPSELKSAMWLTLLGGLCTGPLTALRTGNLTEFESGAARIPSFSFIGNNLARWLSSRISPLRACLHPLWAIVLLASVALAAASAYRNAVAAVGFIYIAAVFYHGGMRSFLGSILMGIFALALLALINATFPLPGNIQRALSPLPGTWEEEHTRGAEISTEWRMEMWREALLTETWIKNKVFGDGIGFTAEELQRSDALEAKGPGRGITGLSNQQEAMLANGSYHSGPVHSVRMTGYVGLAILLMAMIRIAVHAHRQIKRCRGTEWFPVALFFCIPHIIEPIFFTFIFGEYHYAVVKAFMGIAMIRLMERNLPLPAYIPHKLREHIPMAIRSRSGSAQNA